MPIPTVADGEGDGICCIAAVIAPPVLLPEAADLPASGRKSATDTAATANTNTKLFTCHHIPAWACAAARGRTGFDAVRAPLLRRIPLGGELYVFSL